MNNVIEGSELNLVDFDNILGVLRRKKCRHCLEINFAY